MFAPRGSSTVLSFDKSLPLLVWHSEWERCRLDSKMILLFYSNNFGHQESTRGWLYPSQPSHIIHRRRSKWKGMWRNGMLSTCETPRDRTFGKVIQCILLLVSPSLYSTPLYKIMDARLCHVYILMSHVNSDWSRKRPSNQKKNSTESW